VLIADEHGQQVLALALGQVAHRVGAVLMVGHVCAGQGPVGTHQHGRDAVSAGQPGLAVVVVAHHGEGGHLALQAPLQALAVGFGGGRVGAAADQAHGLYGYEERLVGRGEDDAVVLLRLQQAAQGLQLLDLGQHVLAGQQHVQAPALLQHLLHCGDGGIQLGQVLVELLHLEVQGLGLHLTDLLNLPEELALPLLQGLLVAQGNGLHLCLHHLRLQLHLLSYRLGLLNAQLNSLSSLLCVGQQLDGEGTAVLHRVLQVGDAVAGVPPRAALTADGHRAAVTEETQHRIIVLLTEVHSLLKDG